LFGLYLFVGFTDIPVAVVCDRGRPNVEVSSTAYRGHFEENRIRPVRDVHAKGRRLTPERPAERASRA
jgi:hypothetical protein